MNESTVASITFFTVIQCLHDLVGFIKDAVHLRKN